MKTFSGSSRSLNSAAYLPIGLFIHDLPVPKTRNELKSTIADVSINDGLHMHGIVLGNRWGRRRVGLDEHFVEKMGQYLINKIRNIHVEPITHNPGYTVGYTLKGLVKRTASLDDVLVLNWGGSYLRPSRFSRWSGQFPEAVAFLKQVKLLPSD